MATSRKVSTFWCGKVMIGGPGGTRTRDLLTARYLGLNGVAA